MSESGMTQAVARKRLSPEDRREEILLAARATFGDHGMRTTMRDIAERAGITEPHLYRHFRKEELFQYAVVAQLDHLEDQIIQETKELLERPGITRLELLGHFHEL